MPIVKYPPAGSTPAPSFPSTLPPVTTPVQPSALPSAPTSTPTYTNTTPSQQPTVPPTPPTTNVVNNSVSNAITQQIIYSNMSVGYWKIDLERTRTNIYGESSEKWYWEPVIVPCTITRGEITVIESDFGIDTKQTLTLTVPLVTFQNLGFTPEVGDIIGDADKYYEVDNISTDFVTMPGTGTTNNTSTTPGQYITYQMTAHLTRVSKLNLLPFRL
jgi:hypothetical protein